MSAELHPGASLRQALAALASGIDLNDEAAHDAVLGILDGGGEPPEIAAFLTALRVKGETAGELSGAVRAVRRRMIAFDAPEGGVGAGPLLDTCGTGGDGAATLNISTASALVAAACGARVVKHGNRSASGVSGSSDVLATLGIEPNVPPETSRLHLAELGIAFLFAPRYHPALGRLALIRKLLPFRTLFNLVGPLANPARPGAHLLGTGDPALADILAETLSALGGCRAAVVTGSDGLDEVTLEGPTRVRWVEPGSGLGPLTVWNPEDFGLPRVEAASLRVRDPAESAERIRRILDADEREPGRFAVLANTAAALVVAGLADSLRAGVARATEAIDSGTVADRLARWQRLAQDAV